MNPVLDVNVYLSRWPERRLPFDDTAELVTYLKNKHVQQAWVGSFDGLLHKDMSAVNQRLYDECQQHAAEMLIPFGSINPKLSGWQEDLLQCKEQFKMPGIRLHPNYHGYTLQESVAAAVFEMAAREQLIVQVAVKMEDERTQPRLLTVPEVDVAPLIKLAQQHPQLKIVLLNSMRTLRGALLEQVGQQQNIFVEIAMLEGVAGITKLLKTVPLNQVLFGSYFPFFYWQSAELKLQESELGKFQTEKIRHSNAKPLI